MLLEDVNEKDTVIEKKTQDSSMHPKEVLKTGSFWILWGTFSCLSFAIVFIPSLYKVSGWKIYSSCIDQLS